MFLFFLLILFHFLIVSFTDSIGDNIFNGTETNPLQFRDNYHLQTSANLTANENGPLVSSLSSHHQQSDADNELHDGNDDDTVALVESIPTVVPIHLHDTHGSIGTNATRSTLAHDGHMNPTTHHHHHHYPGSSGTLTTTPSLQIKNGTKLHPASARKPTNARTAIKLSSPAAVGNQTQSNHRPDAPMLNYIFDAHLASKHSRYDR